MGKQKRRKRREKTQKGRHEKKVGKRKVAWGGKYQAGRQAGR